MTGPPGAKRVDRAAASEHGWGWIQWLVDGTIETAAGITVGYVEIEPGRKNDRHRHPNCDEVLFLIDGELDHTVGDATVHLNPGSAVWVPAGVPHDATNTGTVTARMVVAYPTGARGLEPVQD